MGFSHKYVTSVASARAERKQRKKKGLRLTAVVMAVALLVCAAGYAAGTITKTLQGLREQVSSLENQQGKNQTPGSQNPDGNASQPARNHNSETEASDVTTKANSELPHDGKSVVATAEAAAPGVMITDVSDIVESALPSVVSIVVTKTATYDSYWGGKHEYETQGAGSGIIIGDDGSELWIVTNYHVIEETKTIEIQFCDEETAEAYIKGTNKDNDLAVLGVKLDDLKKSTMDSIKVITIGSSDDLKLGQGVIAIGNALGWGQSVTTGVVSAFNREVEFEDGTKMFLLQTSAAINPGNSGGALLNSKGELIGINNAKYKDVEVEGVGFAIPISSVREIMEQLSLMQPRTPVADKDYPYLGVTFKNLSSAYIEANVMPEGVFVFEVGEGTPAEKAGILPYDILTAFNGAKISSYDDLVNEMQYYSGGTEVTLTVMRLDRGEYSPITIELTLGYRSDYQG